MAWGSGVWDLGFRNLGLGLSSERVLFPTGSGGPHANDPAVRKQGCRIASYIFCFLPNK